MNVACSAGVFFGRANVFARESAMLKLPEELRGEEEMGQVKGCGEGMGREKRKSPFPSFALVPTLRVTILLSPIFHYHEIKDGGYNNTNTNKVSPTQNTPALQAKMNVKSTSTNGFSFRMTNSLIESWGYAFWGYLCFSFFKPINFNSLISCVKSTTFLNSFKNMMIKYFWHSLFTLT